MIAISCVRRPRSCDSINFAHCRGRRLSLLAAGGAAGEIHGSS